MRAPPPLRELPRYPITGGLMLLAIGVTAVWAFEVADISPVVLDVRAFWGEPWRLLTSILPHVGIFHLVFNCYWLWVFGTLLEDVHGHARLAALVGLFAAVSGAAEYALFDGGVGLSGVGYGLFGFVWVQSSRDPRFVGAMDRTTVNLFGGWFLLCIVLTATDVFPVANVAHGVGALAGMGMGLVVVDRFRWPAAVGLGLLAAASFLGASTLRPAVNLSSGAGQDSAYLGYRALVESRPGEAVMHYERALAFNADPRWWYNLGLAHYRLHQPDRAKAALGRALALDPPNEDQVRALLRDLNDPSQPAVSSPVE